MRKKQIVDILVNVKKDIHPKVNTACVVKCACGNTFTTVSTLNSISVEICSACHPFFTGTRRFVDTERRIDKFTKKYQLAEEKKKVTIAGKKAKEEKAKKVKVLSKKSVKEVLDDLKTETTA